MNIFKTSVFKYIRVFWMHCLVYTLTESTCEVLCTHLQSVSKDSSLSHCEEWQRCDVKHVYQTHTYFDHLEQNFSALLITSKLKNKLLCLDWTRVSQMSISMRPNSTKAFQAHANDSKHRIIVQQDEDETIVFCDL